MVPGERAQKFHTKEMKIHVYAKRQTSDSSWEFLRIENKHIKTVQNSSYVFVFIYLPHDYNNYKKMPKKCKKKWRGGLKETIELMYRTGAKLLIFVSWSNKQLTTIKGKTWSRGTNSRFPFGVNVNLNLSTDDV